MACTKTILEMPKALRKTLGNGERSDTFAKTMALSGQVFRDVKNRKTMRVNIGGESYFIKQHRGIGWAEIFKNLTVLKWPILGALTEAKAIQAIDSIGILTTPLIAFGRRGCNPATQQSFLLTQDLGEITQADDWFAKAAENDPNREKLITQIAKIAAKLHAAGWVHRDFYLCHFVFKNKYLAESDRPLYLIDLHRAQGKQAPNGQAVMKDMAALIFSAKQIGWSSADLTLLKSQYLPQSADFWAQAEARAAKLLRKFNSDKFQTRLTKEKEKNNY